MIRKRTFGVEMFNCVLCYNALIARAVVESCDEGVGFEALGQAEQFVRMFSKDCENGSCSWDCEQCTVAVYVF